LRKGLLVLFFVVLVAATLLYLSGELPLEYADKFVHLVIVLTGLTVSL